jgi:hypothetical protein
VDRRSSFDQEIKIKNFLNSYQPRTALPAATVPELTHLETFGSFILDQFIGPVVPHTTKTGMTEPAVTQY